MGLILFVGNAVVDDETRYTIPISGLLLKIIQALSNHVLKMLHLRTHIDQIEWDRLFGSRAFQELSHGEVTGRKGVSHADYRLSIADGLTGQEPHRAKGPVLEEDRFVENGRNDQGHFMTNMIPV